MNKEPQISPLTINDQEWLDLLKDDLDTLTLYSKPFQGAASKISLKPGERRLVTALFLDMKGFTNLSERLDHEMVNEIVDRIFNIFKNHIETRGGWVEKYEGDAILAAFGAKVSHEDDAARAIDAALAIQNSMRGLQPLLCQKGLDITIRIGVNSGEVTRSHRAEFDVLVGDTINVAARLEQNATPGSVLVSVITRQLAGDYFDYENHPDVIAKGKSKPLPVYTVSGKSDRPERRQRSQLAARTAFVGRESELTQLLDIYRQCYRKAPESSEQRSAAPVQHLLVDLEGEAGMGKSRLINEFLQSLAGYQNSHTESALHQKFSLVLKGTAAAYAGKPYEMMSAMLGEFFGIDRENLVSKHRLDQALQQLADFSDNPANLPSLSPLLGMVLGLRCDDPRVQSLDSKSLRTEIAVAIRIFIETVAARAHATFNLPLLLLWEDFHWIDESSREIIEFIIANARTPLPMMVVVSHRPGSRLPSFSERRVKSVRLELKSLQPDEGVRLIKSMLPGLEVTGSLLSQIQERGEGNPFYLEELMHHWIDKGLVYEEAGVYKLDKSRDLDEVPTTLRGLLIARVDTLEDDLRRVLQHASVIGSEFTSRTLAWIESELEGGVDPQPALHRLETLAFILREEDRTAEKLLKSEGSEIHKAALVDSEHRKYRFKHILIRDVVYSSLLRWNRKQLHKITAEAIESIHTAELERYYAQLGLHWREAGERSKAIFNFLKAGHQAQRLYDNPAAFNAYSQASELLDPDDREQMPVLLSRGEMAQAIGKMAEAKGDFERSLAMAKQCKDRRIESNAQNCLGSIHFRSGRFTEALQWYELSLAGKQEIGDRLGESQVVSNIGNVNYCLGNYDQAMVYYERSRATQKELDDNKGQGETANNIGVLFFVQGQLEQALSYFQESLRFRRQLGDRRGEGALILNFGTIHNVQGRFDVALECFQQSLALARETGDLQRESQALNNLGIVYLTISKLGEAKKHFQQSLDIKEELGDQQGIANSLVSLGNTARSQSNFGEAIAFFERALTIQRTIGDRRREAESLNNLGLVKYESGFYIKALEYHQQACELRESLKDQMGISDSLINIGKVHYVHGNLDEANYCHQKAIGIKQAMGDRAGEGYAVNDLGDVYSEEGKLDEALVCYDRALKIFKALNDRKGEAVALANTGTIHYLRGRYEQALLCFQDSLTIREKISNPMKISFILYRIGDVHLAQCNFDKAQQFFQQSLDLKRAINDRQGVAFALHGQATVCYLTSQLEPASQFYREALEIRSELEQKNMTLFTTSMLARTLALLGDISSALALSNQSLQWLEDYPGTRFFRFAHPAQLLFTHYIVLQSLNDATSSFYLDTAHKELQDYLGLFTTEERQILIEHPLYRPIYEAWQSCRRSDC